MSKPSLEQLERAVWSEGDFNSYEVQRCHDLRKKPVDELSVEDLRLLISQQIGLAFLLPRAVDVLEATPLARGDYYPGDLFVTVVRCSPWLREKPELLERVVTVAQRVIAMGTLVSADVIGRAEDFVAEASGQPARAGSASVRPPPPSKR